MLMIALVVIMITLVIVIMITVVVLAQHTMVVIMITVVILAQHTMVVIMITVVILAQHTMVVITDDLGLQVGACHIRRRQRRCGLRVGLGVRPICSRCHRDGTEDEDEGNDDDRYGCWKVLSKIELVTR
jgi:hypothetical protein